MPGVDVESRDVIGFVRTGDRVGRPRHPSVATDSATSISATTAVLNATIDTNNEDTTYYFEYGRTDAYGSTTTDESLAASVTSSQVSATMTGLSADTTYLFTIVASNASGSSEGIGVTFTTAQTSCSVDAKTVATDQEKSRPTRTK